MVPAIIVDDEINGRENLANLIFKFCPDIQITGMASSVDDAIEMIKNRNPELVFLDIEMPFKNGFDLLEMVNPITFDVIFTTAFDHYAVRAIKFSALDYLLKPIDIEELKQSVAKLLQKKAAKESSAKNFELLLSNLKVRNKLQKIAVPTLDGLVFINIMDIIRCEADDNYTRIFIVNSDALLVSRTLKDYEDMLSGMNFFRIHHANLINLQHVKKYIRGEGGFVVLSDNISVEVSRRRKNEFLKLLGQMDQ
jgi:two-component system LytT family response regulator